MDEKLEAIKKTCDERDESDEKFEALKEIYEYVRDKNIKNVPENTQNRRLFKKIKNNVSVEESE